MSVTSLVLNKPCDMILPYNSRNFYKTNCRDNKYGLAKDDYMLFI